MSTTQQVAHTPGPWQAEEHPNPGFGMDVTTEQETICQHIDNPADARLIAAAPEMYEALQLDATADKLERDDPEQSKSAIAMFRAQAQEKRKVVIAKATGNWDNSQKPARIRGESGLGQGK